MSTYSRLHFLHSNLAVTASPLPIFRAVSGREAWPLLLLLSNKRDRAAAAAVSMRRGRGGEANVCVRRPLKGTATAPGAKYYYTAQPTHAPRPPACLPALTLSKFTCKSAGKKDAGSRKTDRRKQRNTFTNSPHPVDSRKPTYNLNCQPVKIERHSTRSVS